MNSGENKAICIPVYAKWYLRTLAFQFNITVTITHNTIFHSMSSPMDMDNESVLRYTILLPPLFLYPYFNFKKYIYQYLSRTQIFQKHSIIVPDPIY